MLTTSFSHAPRLAGLFFGSHVNFRILLDGTRARIRVQQVGEYIGGSSSAPAGVVCAHRSRRGNCPCAISGTLEPDSRARGEPNDVVEPGVRAPRVVDPAEEWIQVGFDLALCPDDLVRVHAAQVKLGASEPARSGCQRNTRTGFVAKGRYRC